MSRHSGSAQSDKTHIEEIDPQKNPPEPPATPWYAHATVATVIKKDNRYLMVYEHTQSGQKYNQPAGHLEPNETLLEAAIRETKEETGYTVEPTGLLRVNQFTAPSNGVTYLRVTLTAEVIAHDSSYRLDEEIIEAVWLTKKALIEKQSHLRSPLVLSDIEFAEKHSPAPLDFIHCL